MPPKAIALIKAALYVSAFALVIHFIYQQGSEPWRLLGSHWEAIISTLVICLLGTATQAFTFRECLPRSTPPPKFLSILRIWNISSGTSLVAPIFSGLALRTIMLTKENVGVRAAAVATLRQTIINLECAWLAGSATLIFYPYPKIPPLGGILLGVYVFWKAVAAIVGKLKIMPTFLLESGAMQSNQLLRKELFQPAFWGQLLLMSANYYFVFLFFHSPLDVHHCVLMASLTILSGLIFFLPNGAGILDALWVFVATQQGMSAAESAAIIITMRCGFLVSTIVMWVAIRVTAPPSTPT